MEEEQAYHQRYKKLSIAPEKITENENKKLLIGSIVPRPIALVSTLSHAGVVNLAPFSYFNIVTYDPPILSIAVQRIDGEQKDTARNMMEKKEAVVQIVDRENIDAVNVTAKPLKPHESELDISAFTIAPSKVVQVPGVNETKIRFETTLHDSMIIYNDANMATTDVLFLRVEQYHIDERIYHNGYIDPLKLNAVSRLAGNDYADIGSIFTLERPK